MSIEFHEYANLFPMMTQQEHAALVADMRENGYRAEYPIYILNGKILDGRNRYRAATEAEVMPRYVDYDGDNPLQFVISGNLNRRHLNESQRAVVAARLANMPYGGAIYRSANLQTDSSSYICARCGASYFGKNHVCNISQSAAADMLNVSPRTVATIKAIEKAAPEFIPMIESGEMTAHEASKEVKAKQRQEERAEAAKSAPRHETNHKLYHGDMMEVLQHLDRFDLVVADPPYNVTPWDWDKRGDRAKFLSEVNGWIEAIAQHLKPEYNFFWFCSPSYAADTEIIIRELGLPIQSRIVWHRRNMAKGSDAKYKFIDTWEMIFHIGNRPLNFSTTWDESRFDVQTFAVPQTNFTDTKYHPTQKPLELIKWIVSYGSFDGDTVLDPFAGSGTTGVACDNRTCAMIEREAEYIKVIEQRLGIEHEGL